MYELAVWLNGVRVAQAREQRTGRMVLEYTDEALAAFPVGRPLLSMALPLQPGRRFPPAVTGAWLEALLPEGRARTTLESMFEVRRGDVVGLLVAIGRDCAGAVQWSFGYDGGW